MNTAVHTESGHALTMRAPRLLNSAQAAKYVGLSDSGFAARVADDVMPKPVKIGKRRLWDIKMLDKAIDRMSGLGASSTDPILERIREVHQDALPQD